MQCVIVYVCVYVYVYVCMYVRMCVCVSVCLYDLYFCVRLDLCILLFAHI